MRPYSQVIEQLRTAGLRPTRQRLALAKLLFENAPRHITAETLHAEAQAASVPVSLATIYNTLHQFTAVGLLKEIVIDTQRSHFDTTTSDHGHFYFEDTGQLQDIPSSDVMLAKMPALPEGSQIKSIEVVVRVSSK